MTYQVLIPKPVQKQLNKIPQPDRQRILAAIRQLEEVPRPDGVKKLKGYDAAYRIRVGTYRLIYEVRDQELVVLLLSAMHRKDIYR
ncbi:MAG: type II toxin-antitoxin system RelE/ParE family toxin [Prochlorothrix sp.]|nr:type II toxin-antitoxin system RelE/ParE family toxin [Prochlorothrix sp.]